MVPIDAVEEIKTKYPLFNVYVYPEAGLAFFNPEQNTYNKLAAELAWKRSIKFLDKLSLQK